MTAGRNRGQASGAADWRRSSLDGGHPVRPQAQARTGLAIVAWLFVGCVFLQVFLAGLGVFGRQGFGAHQLFGYLFGWLTLAMLILAIVGRTGRRLIGLSALALVMFALQSVFVLVRADLPIVAALHPVNGVAIGFVALAIARGARDVGIREAAGWTGA
jgi:mercuric ion transport protein